MKTPFKKGFTIKTGYLFAASILLFALGGSGAYAMAEDNPPSKMKLEGVEWMLASSGVRTYAFIDVYQCALYLKEPGKVRKTILEQKQPVTIRIKILTSELPGQVPDAWKETIKPEVSDKVYRRFKKNFKKLEEGDELLFSYTPGQATLLYLNREKVFSDPGAGLMYSLLDQWVGEEPISDDLKTALVHE
ncbi:MAG: hypothetical protein G3M70_02525 [Candidatus Nitronauta litoralis]|uniref:Chalcone isomerase domain-containing protein n=1 Tax=Candidatus Nitronauta litoralis TaxID=2705533 RepID=A0A7T0BTT4_9BACT|nr:MAG: hypothetical protein G3M70_02525 [Candidatus Nitronauta litoralis]